MSIVAALSGLKHSVHSLAIAHEHANTPLLVNMGMHIESLYSGCDAISLSLLLTHCCLRPTTRAELR
jgi:hypothetical protein